MGIGWPQKPEEGELSAADAARFIPRQDYLQGEYGFRCACLRCRVEEAIPDSGEEDELDDAEGHEGAGAGAGAETAGTRGRSCRTTKSTAGACRLTAWTRASPNFSTTGGFIVWT